MSAFTDPNPLRIKSVVMVAMLAVLGLASGAATAADPVAAAVVPVPAALAPEPPSAAWWQPSENPAFQVEFVGQAAGQTAMVIRFSVAVGAPASISKFIRVIDESGAVIPGDWQPGGVAQVIVKPGLAPGRYSVIIDPRLASVRGDTLNTLLNGAVLIR